MIEHDRIGMNKSKTLSIQIWNAVNCGWPRPTHTHDIAWLRFVLDELPVYFLAWRGRGDFLTLASEILKQILNRHEASAGNVTENRRRGTWPMSKRGRCTQWKAGESLHFQRMMSLPSPALEKIKRQNRLCWLCNSSKHRPLTLYVLLNFTVLLHLWF